MFLWVMVTEQGGKSIWSLSLKGINFNIQKDQMCNFINQNTGHTVEYWWAITTAQLCFLLLDK